MALWTPFRAGERLTAGRLNALVTEWIPYQPIWQADVGTVTLNDGTLTGKYQRIGNTINFRIFFEWGPNTTQSNPSENWRFSLPATPQSADGVEFWPVSLWITHDAWDLRDPGNPRQIGNHRWSGGGYIDPSRNAVYAMAYNGSNGYMDADTFPSYYAETSAGSPDPQSVSPDEQAVRPGDQINVYGSYEAID